MIRIYQLYFKEEQKQFLNPLHYHYDNTINLNPNDREYPLLKECYKISVNDDVKLWGAVSWNYKYKFSANELISDSCFLDYINDNPGYDVYFFNPFTNHVPIIYNVWEQGQWCHPHMITIMEHLFPLMGLRLDLLYKPQTRDTICFGSMCVGNKEFWDGYFELAEKFIQSIDKLPENVKELYNGSTNYVDNSINYFSFIQERLMSLYLSMNEHRYKILPFHINEHSMPIELHELNSLKYKILKNNDIDSANIWRKKRLVEKNRIYSTSAVDWAKFWIDRFINEYSFQPIEHNVYGKKGFTNKGLVNYLRKNIETDSSLLDLGCGPRLYSNSLKDLCDKILCLDAWAEVKPDIILDLEKHKLTDFIGVNFDYVLLLDVIEHLDKQSGYRLLNECKKLTNKKIFLLTPLEEIWSTNEENVDNHELWCHNNSYDYHKSIWSSKDFADWVEVKLPGMDNFFFGYFENKNENFNNTGHKT